MEQINLYTPELHPKRLWFPANWTAGAAAGVALALAVGTGYLHWRAATVSDALRDARRELETASNKLEAKRVQFQSRQQGVEELETKVSELRSELQALDGVGDILQQRLRAAGSKARVLKALGQASAGLEGVWLTRITLEGSAPLRVKLTGRTDRPEAVPAYLQRVAEQPVFREGFFQDVTVGDEAKGNSQGGPLRFEAAADFRLAREGGGP
jgi:septal ring factor EnvC (AmiA/AmiB activator)